MTDKRCTVRAVLQDRRPEGETAIPDRSPSPSLNSVAVDRRHVNLGPFGDWLAGFIDGEGCFLIPYRRDRDYWYCQFRIRVRGDDSDVIEEIHSRTGIGRTFFHRRNTDLPNRGDLACWEVSSRGDCKQLVAILERHPLRAKKARDYAIWREAVIEWHKVTSGGSVEWRRGANGGHWEKIAELSSELRAGRKYLRAA